MKNFWSPGNAVEILAPANVVSGAVVVTGQMFGVAATTELSGAKVNIHCGGVFNLAKQNAASMSMAQGANVYWDSTNSVATANASGTTRIGVAVNAVTNVATNVLVRLNSSFP